MEFFVKIVFYEILICEIFRMGCLSYLEVKNRNFQGGME